MILPITHLTLIREDTNLSHRLHVRKNMNDIQSKGANGIETMKEAVEMPWGCERSSGMGRR
jgi:hypothetical protein